MAFVADTTYAPQLLVFRGLTEWPSLSEQVAVYGRLTGEGFLNINTFALLDFRQAVVPTPTGPDAPTVMAGGPRRRAYVVNTPEQRDFITAMQERAPRAFELQAFGSEADAVAWLFAKRQAFPVTFLDQPGAR